MRLEQFQYVVAIAECRSLSKAARDLFLTQPTLSVSLQNLEAELGFQLFHRSHMGMVLTEKGRTFYQIALRVQEELAQVRRLSEPEENPREVNLAAAPVFCNAAILHLLADLKQSAPELVLNIREVHRSDALPSLLDHRASLSIGLYTDEEEKQLCQQAAQNRIVMEPLLRDHMFVYLPKRHPLAYEESVHIAQLEQDNVLLLRENRAEDDLPHRVSGGYYCFSERDSVLKAVSKQMGYAILPGLMALDNLYVETGLVAVRPLADGKVPVTMYLAYSSSSPLTANETAVVNAIYSTCRSIQRKWNELPSVPYEADIQPPTVYY